MTDTTTGAAPSKADIAWNVIKMVFHSNTINAQTDISDFFTPDRLIFYQNLFNGSVATQINGTTPYRWAPVKDTEFSGITTGGALETVVEAHLTDPPATSTTSGATTGGKNA